MAADSLYPPGPTDVPVDLTEPTPEYRRQIAFVLLPLSVFFVVYFGLLAACVLYGVWTIVSIGLAGLHGGAGLAGLACVQVLLAPFALLLFIYLAKNLLRRGGKEKTDHVEIFEDEHPRLFNFIYRTCDDTGASYPKRVFVNFEVNAMAFNDGNSLRHLFMPTDKNLLIGLGLVNAVNLTEFKALLAHEFGHFSQKSTRLSAFVYTAFGIINQIVEGRDIFDRIADGLRGSRSPLGMALGYAMLGILWSMRGPLMGLRYVIFFFHQGLSRQMEFNADLVAVSVTGSDAPVHLLYRSVFADHCLNQSIRDLHTALDHQLYTSDMFFHQSHAGTFLRRRERNPLLGEPPVLPVDRHETTTVFESDRDEQANMWATHPSNRARERNAKECYIRSHFDVRSPWLLFDNVEQLRADVTYKFYRVHFRAKRTLYQTGAEEVQSFINDERSETTFDPKYQGLYDYRNLELRGITELADEARKSPSSVLHLSQCAASMYKVEVKHRAQLHNKRLEERGLLNAVARGWHRPSSGDLEFRGKLYGLEDAKRLLKKVDRELAEDRDWLREFDRNVFLAHYQMALRLKEETANDLFKRYQFHLALQVMWADLKEREIMVNAALAFINNLKTTTLSQAVFDEALAIFRDAHATLSEHLDAAEHLRIPAMKNLPTGEPLRDFLLKKRLVEGLSRYDLHMPMKWIAKLIDQMGEVQKKVDRIHFKSLGGILALQEQIAAACLKEWAELPTVSSVVPEIID
jgi:Zn-dependent protease with chaperone function